MISPRTIEKLSRCLLRFYLWQPRHCSCCNRPSIFITYCRGDEWYRCIWCRANRRYEMLAELVRAIPPEYRSRVVEFDPSSPLQKLFDKQQYTRTIFSSRFEKGTVIADNLRCEDITALTFPNDSFDLMISSDVLEHVVDLRKALEETRRVLRPGGVHLFTVPPRPATRPRARLENGEIKYLLPAEYHLDPLNPKGVLTWWDIGPDLNAWLGDQGLELSIVSGPRGAEGRIVWQAKKLTGQIPADLQVES